MAQPTKTRKVVLEGRGTFTLRPDDYVTQGGEGIIYRSGDTIVKLYADASKMQQPGMIEKIKLLAALKHETIVAPQGLVTEASGEPIGYYMPFAEGEPFSRVFTNDFRQRANFGDTEARVLVAGMHDTVRVAHASKAIMVDANELNWLANVTDPKKPSPRIIDVDSWVLDGKIPSVVPKMASIRDHHGKLVSIESDWFAWGIVSFQIFTGIHPYKGVLAGFKPTDFSERMKANKSVFTPGVGLNRAVRDFGCIPGPLLAWYEAAFQHGERSVPPSPLATGTAIPAAARVTRVVTTATGSLVFDKVFTMPGLKALRLWPCGVVHLSDGSLIDLASRRTIGNVTAKDVEVTKVDGGWLIGSVSGRTLSFSYTDETTGKEEPLALALTARGLFRAGNRMFAVTDRGITELKVTRFAKAILSTGSNWGALPNSTQWFDGVGVQDALGAMFIIAPFGDKSCAITKVPELDGLKVVSAKAGPRYAVFSVVDKNGSYERIELTFDRDYTTYKIERSPTDVPELNITILPKGVAASIRTDGELLIIVPTANKVSTVSDKHIATDMSLCNWGDKVMYIQNGEIWSLRMT